MIISAEFDLGGGGGGTKLKKKKMSHFGCQRGETWGQDGDVSPSAQKHKVTLICTRKFAIQASQEIYTVVPICEFQHFTIIN